MTATQPQRGEIALTGRILEASNATFLGQLGEVPVIYKPVAGERPLWDFPDGTLARREVAAYEVSQVLGWRVVPPTWLRDGPLGPGMVQLWQEPDQDSGAVALVPATEIPEHGWRHVLDGIDEQERPVSLLHEDSAPLRRMAVFDVLTNNADRKGGHVLAMADGHRYGVDHGLTFHTEPKLRTILWGWLGEELTDEERDGVSRVLDSVVDGELRERLARLVEHAEVAALEERARGLLESGRFPAPSGDMPAIPWPPL